MQRMPVLRLSQRFQSAKQVRRLLWLVLPMNGNHADMSTTAEAKYLPCPFEIVQL
ncbi:MAG: hypothetical protein R3C17_17565 [Planctomycetaceae bacterium]